MKDEVVDEYAMPSNHFDYIAALAIKHKHQRWFIFIIFNAL